jgi:hypothetical protein
MTDSSTGGYLLSTTTPTNDLDLDVVFQNLIAGLTGIDGQYVRPRFQDEPTPPPTKGITWVAVGIMTSVADTYPAVAFVDGTGDVLIHHERIDVLCSFYGPKAERAKASARDGLIIGQNREVIAALGIDYIGPSNELRVPVQIKTIWTNRIDMTLTFHRQIIQTYDVLSIETSAGILDTDSHTTPISVPFNTANQK